MYLINENIMIYKTLFILVDKQLSKKKKNITSSIYRNFILKNKYRNMIIRTNIYLITNNIIFIDNKFFY